ncbi:hypothetical protein BDP55DRAFT_88110 [Colletotrichum godetiae]|uniref:Uncharacterized protein n=1 Tax=Colletotrichum godetiae TaxID=1209918 RepID=A0AAJ0EVM8_9PEZI|nr:uncharacterized protein BDP55DRAFT_88110 [Colletotrichum godetiae]KAK1687820.1 hypothetical protein BDP55DRAFT_88110 [Colletotrichum godetiae]
MRKLPNLPCYSKGFESMMLQGPPNPSQMTQSFNENLTVSLIDSSECLADGGRTVPLTPDSPRPGQSRRPAVEISDLMKARMSSNALKAHIETKTRAFTGRFSTDIIG